MINNSEYDKMVNSGAYELHHTAKARGYVRRNSLHDHSFEVIPYAGRFGKGYVAAIPLLYTTQYYDKEYWIEKKDKRPLCETHSVYVEG